MKIRPLSDRIVVKPNSAESNSPGGIIIPAIAQEKPQFGSVVSVGPGKIAENGQRIVMSIVEGDTVLYGKYSGIEVTIDNVEYIVMHESDVLAVVNS